jgi:lysophospholipase L1-like esterase
MNIPIALVKLWTRWEARRLEHALKETKQGESRPVVFYGSSSIRLWSTLAEDLSAPDVVNLGFGGSTLADCVLYFERLVLPRNPRSLLLYAGDNDLGEGLSAQDVVDSFRALIRKVDHHLGPIRFAFLSIKPSPARWYLIEAIRQANAAILEDLSAKTHCTYIDIVEPMLGPSGRPRPELYAEDGLHLSPAGYKVWTAEILKHRERIFP